MDLGVWIERVVLCGLNTLTEAFPGLGHSKFWNTWEAEGQKLSGVGISIEENFRTDTSHQYPRIHAFFSIRAFNPFTKESLVTLTSHLLPLNET